MDFTMDDGVRLAVEITGSGPGLVLVHGFGGAKEDFADHVPDLARDHTVVIFDHRGHGSSDAPDDPASYSIDRFVVDTLAVADQAGFERFRLLGHSMGGVVARRIVFAHPDRVDALVLMDTTPGAFTGITPELADVAAQIALTEGKEVLKPLLDEAGTLDTPAYLRLLEERPDYPALCDQKWANVSAVMWGTILPEFVRLPDELARMAEIRCPTLVIVGEQDEHFVEGSRAMAATIPGAQLVVIPDAGHSPQYENAAAWSAAMHTFLGSLVTA